jgi:beta-lactamase class A
MNRDLTIEHLSRLSARATALAMIAIVVGLAGCSPSDTAVTPTAESNELAESSPSATVQPTPFTLNEPTQTPSPLPIATQTPIAPPTPQVEPSLLSETLDQLLVNEPGVFGIVVRTQDGTYLYARNSGSPFIAASLYKLVLLADILGRVESGEVNLAQELVLDPLYFPDEGDDEDSFFDRTDEGLTTTVETALFATGAYSSNVAARALRTLTSPEELTLLARQLGMQSTEFLIDTGDLPFWPEKYLSTDTSDALLAVAFVEAQNENGPIFVTTPHDIAEFWLRVLNREVVSEWVSSRLLDILEEQVVTDRLPALLQEGVVLANKTGNLYHVVHDSGIVLVDGEPVVVVAMSQGEPDDSHGAEVLQRVALAVIGESTFPPYSWDNASQEAGT